MNLKYLGGLKVLLSFGSPEEAEEFRYNKVNDWEKWFARLYLWVGIPPLFERVAWIKILGVPISLWDQHVINKIGERFGRLLVKSEADASDGNMAEDRLAILVNTGKRIASELNLVWKGQVISVWVEEISGKWSPAFLNEETSDWEAPVMSTDSDGSVSSGDSESERCMGVPSFSCMENQIDCTSTCPEAAVSAAHGDLNVTYGDLNEVREAMGHVENNTDSAVENFVVGPDGNACDNEAQCDFNNESINNESVRPSYITQRPKREAVRKSFPRSSNLVYLI
ncbi:hypothetical protein HanRHA438_Chr08g0370491 [Helianthus annuus]|nr:hypothetical protein HanRHA438_Chr08g0370491 [Helianthus annuus]